jgi:hypothetical protein
MGIYRDVRKVVFTRILKQAVLFSIMVIIKENVVNNPFIPAVLIHCIKVMAIEHSLGH